MTNGMHTHYYFGTSGYIPSTIECLHDASDSDAIAYLGSELERYNDGMGTGRALTDAALSEFLAAGTYRVNVSEWDYMSLEACADSDCECINDYRADPGSHECPIY